METEESRKMVVENLKFHSNYRQTGNNMCLDTEGRINKLHPNSIFGYDSAMKFSHDMCSVNDNKVFKKTIVTNKSNGLSFKGYNGLYKAGRAIVDETIENRDKLLAKIPHYKKLAEKVAKEHPYISKIVNNAKFQKAMKFMNDNALLADASIALFYTCAMRPLSIAALPTKDENEKKKNVYQIGHSISTGIIGFLTAFAIQTPIRTAINKVTTNASKYIQGSGKNLLRKENIEKLRSLMERSHQPISLPLKAALTIYLVPKILNVFGLTKVSKTKGQPESALPYDAFRYFASFKGGANNNFQSFKGGLKDASK